MPTRETLQAALYGAGQNYTCLNTLSHFTTDMMENDELGEYETSLIRTTGNAEVAAYTRLSVTLQIINYFSGARM